MSEQTLENASLSPKDLNSVVEEIKKQRQFGCENIREIEFDLSKGDVVSSMYAVVGGLFVKELITVDVESLEIKNGKVSVRCKFKRHSKMDPKINLESRDSVLVNQISGLLKVNKIGEEIKEQLSVLDQEIKKRFGQS